MWIFIFLACVVVLWWLASKAKKPNLAVPPKHAPTEPPQSEDIEAPDSAFSTPQQIYGEARLNDAYWSVVSELTGDGVTPDILLAVKPDLLGAMGDGKKAGRVLADALEGIEWDWPRWHAFAKRNGHSVVADIQPVAEDRSLHTLLYGTLKADLLSLGNSLGVSLPKSASKTEMVKRLMELPVERFEAWIKLAQEKRPTTELQRLQREMGRFVASRIGHLAAEAMRYEQRSDAGVLRLHPYWRFICSNDRPTPAPKRCRDFDQKVLPAAEAMKRFPKLPCDRLDCQCRFTTQRTLT